MKASNPPEFVYKAFRNEDFALSFINEGKLRIGNLIAYRTIEDELRKDRTEGQASYHFEEVLQQAHYSTIPEMPAEFTKRGLMHVSGSWGNPTYVFCTSLHTVHPSYLRKRFGAFIVQIDDPVQLMTDMRDALLMTDFPFIGGGIVQGRYVKYSKGEVLEKDFEEVDSCELATFQKPPEFSPEREYRLIAMMSAVNPPKLIPEFLDLDIGKKLVYTHMC